MDGNVGAIMTREVVTASPGDSVAQVARLLTAHGISAVPVCDGFGNLLGIVSEGDLLRPFGRRHNLRRDWWLGLLAEGTDLAPEFLRYIREDHSTAKDVMTAPVHAAAEGTPLAEAADMLVQLGVKRLPVLRDGKLVGIVSRADLVRMLPGAVQPRGAARGLASSAGASD